MIADDEIKRYLAAVQGVRFTEAEAKAVADMLNRGPAKWNPMKDAPRDGSTVLLLSRIHGVVEARFDQGYWSEDTPNAPREYTGSVWICGDDVFQIEVEETPDGYEDGEAVGWMPRDTLPPLKEEAVSCG